MTQDSELLARALASVYPYDPKYLIGYRHPSLREEFHPVERTLSRWVNLTDPLQAPAALALLRQDAKQVIRGRKVLHFEVVFTEGTLGWRAMVGTTKRST